MRGTAASLLVVCAIVLATSACAGEPSPPPPSSTGTGTVAPADEVASRALTDLTRLAAGRIALSDTVAAAKFGTPSPIEDPAREQQVVEAAGAAAARDGLDPVGTREFFRDQIEASKVVQRGLFAAWREFPEQRPAVRADLRAVRPELDRLGAQMVAQLRATAPERSGAACPAALSTASAQTATSLDPLHRTALTVALRSVCRD